MKELFILIAHLLATVGKLARSSGVRALVAESLLLKHQLLILNRARRRVPAILESLLSVDLFRCESILLRSYWVMVVMDVFTRRIIGLGVERADIDGVSACRMFNHAVAGQHSPKRLSSDHDPLFTFHRWQANLRALDIGEIKSVRYVPLSHPFIERLIGTIRREYLDHVLFWNRFDLQRKLDGFKTYYNQRRVHSSLSAKTPYEQGGRSPPKRADLCHFAWTSECNGLFQMPIAA